MEEETPSDERRNSQRREISREKDTDLGAFFGGMKNGFKYTVTLLILEAIFLAFIFVSIDLAKDFSKGFVNMNTVLLLFGIGVIANLWFSVHSKVQKEPKFRNIFIQAAIFVSLLVTFGGVTAVNEIIPSDYPLMFEVNGSEHAIRGMCDSLNNYEKTVSGDIMKCTINLQFIQPKNLTFNELEYTVITYPSRSVASMHVYSEVLKKDSGFEINNAKVVIQEKGFNDIQLNLKFYNETDELSYATNAVYFKVLGTEEYQQQQNNKISLIIAAITLGLVSSVAAVKNLMDIWDRGKIRS